MVKPLVMHFDFRKRMTDRLSPLRLGCRLFGRAEWANHLRGRRSSADGWLQRFDTLTGSVDIELRLEDSETKDNCHRPTGTRCLRLRRSISRA
jgi:hypothetical protein